MRQDLVAVAPSIAIYQAQFGGNENPVATALGTVPVVVATGRVTNLTPKS